MPYNTDMEHKKTGFEETQEIFIRLEHYDDIFSDFDIRHYSKRALSVDFLDEVMRASDDKAFGGVDLVLYIPEKERSESHDATIKERLAGHFKKHYVILSRNKRKVMRLGFGMTALGVAAMIGATLLHHNEPEGNLLWSFLLVFLEPAAWFLLWEGMDQVIFNSKEIDPELAFYKKMADSHSRIHFLSY